MELSRDELEESNGPGWVELFILTRQAHSAYPIKGVKSESYLDHASAHKMKQSLNMCTTLKYLFKFIISLNDL